MSDGRPNIVLVMTDQQPAIAMGCAGNAFVDTPAMDSIAANGTRFTNAYCTNPVCIPSRVSMFTGRYPHEAGIYSNTRRADALATSEFTWLGRLVADAGYQTIYFGKWHLILDPSNRHVQEKTGFNEGFMMEGDRLLAGACQDFLEEWIDGGQASPFFMVLSFVNPHNICEFARGQRLPGGDIGTPPDPDKCPPLPDNHAIPANEPSVIREVQDQYKDKLYPTGSWSRDEWRQYLWAHDRLVEKVDRELVKILDAVRNAGIEDDTVIIFTSDHGEGLAAHHWNQKQVLYENVARVPLLIQHGRRTGGGEVRDDLVSNGIDVFATICDYAGVPLPAKTRGKSLRGPVEGATDEVDRPSIVAETEFGEFTPVAGDHHGRPAGRMMRTRDYKYIVYSRGESREQLFDMRSDPLEMVNLASDPAHAGVLRDHRDMLSAWCRETGDDFVPLVP